jgi:hypothetical protein
MDVQRTVNVISILSKSWWKLRFIISDINIKFQFACFLNLDNTSLLMFYVSSKIITLLNKKFYQYQQNERPDLTSIHWTQKRPRHMALELQVLALDMHNNVTGLKRLMGSSLYKFIILFFLRVYCCITSNGQNIRCIYDKNIQEINMYV